jgi:hypothetical protein
MNRVNPAPSVALFFIASPFFFYRGFCRFITSSIAAIVVVARALSARLGRALASNDNGGRDIPYHGPDPGDDGQKLFLRDSIVI